MIERVISGGQTGADQAGWRAAKRFGLATGGWMPRGYLTEDGPRPEFAAMYGALEHKSPKYPARTEDNVIWSDLTILFGDPTSRGAMLVRRIEKDIQDSFRPDPILVPSNDDCVMRVAKLVSARQPLILNIAGNRESKAPSIGAWVESFLCDVFRAMGLQELPIEPPTPDPR